MRARRAPCATLLASVRSRPGSSVVRMTSRWLAMGFSTATGRADGVERALVVAGDEAERDDLLPAARDEHVA